MHINVPEKSLGKECRGFYYEEEHLGKNIQTQN